MKLSQLKLGRWPCRLLLLAGTLAALVLLAGALGVFYAARQSGQIVVLPDPTGQFAVGRMAFDWTDEARQDPLDPTGRTKRELVVWVWYPAAPPPGASPAAYVSEPWGGLLDQQHGVGAMLSQRLDAVRAHAVEDAPLAAAQSSYPVLVFLPGFGRTPADYTALAEDLASHGYVVAGVTPTESAPVVVFADGRVVERSELGSIPDAADPATLRRRGDDLVAVWSADARFALDRLAALSAGADSPFAGRLDLGRVGFLGHSFGGATAAEVCRQDDRCRAGADLDGTLFGPVAQAGLNRPFLFVRSDDTSCDGACREGLADQQRVFESLPEGYEVMVAGARHFNFSDEAVLFEPVLKLMRNLGPIDGQRGLAITRAYTRAFFDRKLLGREAPPLAGPSAEYPEAKVQAR